MSFTAIALPARRFKFPQEFIQSLYDTLPSMPGTLTSLQKENYHRRLLARLVSDDQAVKTDLAFSQRREILWQLAQRFIVSSQPRDAQSYRDFAKVVYLLTGLKVKLTENQPQLRLLFQSKDVPPELLDYLFQSENPSLPPLDLVPIPPLSRKHYGSYAFPITQLRFAWYRQENMVFLLSPYPESLLKEDLPQLLEHCLGTILYAQLQAEANLQIIVLPAKFYDEQVNATQDLTGLSQGSPLLSPAAAEKHKLFSKYSPIFYAFSAPPKHSAPSAQSAPPDHSTPSKQSASSKADPIPTGKSSDHSHSAEGSSAKAAPRRRSAPSTEPAFLPKHLFLDLSSTLSCSFKSAEFDRLIQQLSWVTIEDFVAQLQEHFSLAEKELLTYAPAPKHIFLDISPTLFPATGSKQSKHAISLRHSLSSSWFSSYGIEYAVLAISHTQLSEWKNCFRIFKDTPIPQNALALITDLITEPEKQYTLLSLFRVLFRIYCLLDDFCASEIVSIKGITMSTSYSYLHLWVWNPKAFARSRRLLKSKYRYLSWEYLNY